MTLPRFDGLYVSVGAAKDRPVAPGDPIATFFRRFGRAAYTRAYARFFDDGLLVYGGALVNYDPEPARPTLGRDSSSADQFRWTTAEGRLLITAPSGEVSHATIERDRLLWDWGPSYTEGAYTFVQGTD